MFEPMFQRFTEMGDGKETNTMILRQMTQVCLCCTSLPQYLCCVLLELGGAEAVAPDCNVAAQHTVLGAKGIPCGEENG